MAILQGVPAGRTFLALFLAVLCVETTVALWWDASHIRSLTRITSRCAESDHTETSTVCSLTREEQEAMILGAERAINGCRAEFANSVWGCRVSSWPRFMSIRVNKESAFVQAVVSAGVALQLMRICADGRTDSKNCRCPETESGARGACLLHAKYGLRRSKVLDEIIAKETTPTMKNSKRQALVSQHNTRVGRLVTESVLDWRMNCRCVGPSSSCTQKVCWKELPSIKSIIINSRRRFGNAVRVRRKKSKQLSFRQVLESVAKTGQLAFLARSPNFCEVNKKLGVSGPAGRTCEGSECKTVCCNRPLRRKTTQKHCHCKFHYCCKLHCQQCNETTTYCT